MKKLIALVLLFIMIFPTSVFADGVIWHYYNNRLQPLEENEQRAAINYQNGIQKMIIDVNFDMGAGDRAVWVFPVPASPDDVVIDVVTEFPSLYGSDPRVQAKSAIGSILVLSTYTQIYPLFLILPFFIWFTPFSALSSTAGMARESINDVTVHEHIEKEGITTEIITSLSGDALYNYLVGQGLSIERDAIDVFNDYIGKDYSFVVSWVTSSGGTGYVTTGSSCSYQSCSYSDSQCPGYGWDYNNGGSCIEQCDYTGSQGCTGSPHGCFCSGTSGCVCSGGGIAGGSAYPVISPYSSRKQLGIFVTFPTDKIFYPLMPTSIYGSTEIPITIYVLDHVTPEPYDSIRSYVTSDYYISSYTSIGDLKSFYGNMETRNMKYTKIEILDAPAKYFKDDLWFSYGAPINVGLATMIYNAINQQPIIAGIIIILIISAMTGALAGYILFRNWRRYALIGLTNIFSIIVLAIVVLSSKSESSLSADLKARLKKEGLSVIDKKKYSFIPLYSILYLAMCLAVYLFFNLIF